MLLEHFRGPTSWKPHLAFSEKANRRSACREYAVIIESLAAAPHVLLIPKQSLSCFPTVAITEVFWFLLLNGLTVLLHSSSSHRTIHIYHVWAFHSIIEVILFSYCIKYTKLHFHPSCQHYRGKLELLFFLCGSSDLWMVRFPAQNCCIIPPPPQKKTTSKSTKFSRTLTSQSLLVFIIWLCSEWAKLCII